MAFSGGAQLHLRGPLRALRGSGALAASLRRPSRTMASTAHFARRTSMVQGTASAKVLDDDRLLEERGYRPGDRVILFDGVCNMCNYGVNVVLDLDKDDQFKFAALQGDAGQALVRKFHCPTDLSTMVYIDGERAYTFSDAPLQIGRRLPFYSIPSWLALMAAPKRIRDFFYTYVLANNRYRVFGRRKSCRLSTPGAESKFLDKS